MNTNSIRLKSSPFPMMLSDLAHSNQFLKMFSLSSITLVIMSFLVIFFMMNKEPIILTLNTEGKVLEKTAMPKPEDLIKEAIKKYLEKRYIWEPNDVQQKMKDSALFVSQGSQKAFNEAMTNVIRFSVDKQAAQRIYPTNIEINLKDGTAVINGDRLTTIQGLMAAGNLKLVLSFENGPRTPQNPWGIYIIKEKEEL